MFVRLPCGTQQQIVCKREYGRGNPVNLTDPQLSREQVMLEPVPGMEGVLQLTNKGINPIIVESQQPAEQQAAAASSGGPAAAAAAAAPQWHLTDLLDQGQATIVGPHTRFYLASRQATTTFTLLSAQHVQQPQQQEAQQNDPSGSHLQQQSHPAGQVLPGSQMSKEEQEAADAAFAASLQSQEDEQQQRRRQPLGPGSLSRQEQEAADAALAAALAAEEEEDQDEENSGEQRDQEDNGRKASGEESDGPRWEAAAVAAAAAPAAGAAGDEDGNGDAVQAAGRPAKRTKREQQQQQQPQVQPEFDGSGALAAAAAAATPAADGADASAGGVGIVPPSVVDAPFSLLAVRGLAASYNAGCLGARLARLVAGRLSFVLVSNFMVDMGWLLSACPDIKAADKVIVVHGEKGQYAADISAQAAEAGLTSPRFASHAPPLPITYGTHHSKAFLLRYTHGGVRLIVHTANMIYPDCNNKSQGLWYQDFPPKTSDSPTSSEFESSLGDYLTRLQLPGSWATDVAVLVAATDWSAARAALVASVPGYHSGPLSLHAYGHMRLRALLTSTRIPARFKSAPCVMQFSSIGSLDERWLRQEMVASMTAGRYEEAAPAAAAAAAAGPSAGAAAAAAGGGAAGGSNNAFAIMRHAAAVAGGSAVRAGDADVLVQLVWTTVTEVQHSREGWAAGSSIPGRQENVSKPFLQQYYCRWGGEPAGRQSAMPHIKSYTRYIPVSSTGQSPPNPGGPEPQTPAGAGAELSWWLLASHNLSKAAWGSLQKGGSQLMIRSYELGVLLTPELEEAYRRHPHRLYSCTAGDTAPAAAPAAAAADTVVRFYAWNAGQQQQQQQQLQQAPGTGTMAAAAAASGNNEISAFADVLLPVPYLLPPQHYAAGDKPWCVDVQHPGRDQVGCTCAERSAGYYGNTEPPW